MIPGSANPLLLASAAAAPAGYAISRSLRFNSSDSAYLSRTPSTAGNRRVFAWAAWVKRGAVDNGDYSLFFAGSDNANITWLEFSSAALRFGSRTGNDTVIDVITSALFRDPSAWYHVVLSVDTPRVSAANRVQIYVNGVLQPYTGTIPLQNADLWINTMQPHAIGFQVFPGIRYFNGCLADIHFCDGNSYTASAFGEFDANGIWQPKAYTGSYGTNGFHLAFSDNSTAGSLGDDSSGNGNNWTVNNISVAAGAGNDSLVDVPTNGTETDTGIGGEVRGNYCTGNPIAKNTYGSTLSFANGNLDWTFSGNAFATIAATSGKWYAEVVFTTAGGAARGVGVAPYDWSSIAAAYFSDGTKYLDGVNSSYSGVTFTTGDIIGIAWDADSKQVTFYKNNVSQGSMTYTNTKDLTFVAFRGGTEGTSVCAWNFGQRPFAYPVSGYKSLCTANLPSTTITTSGSYTGNGVADGPFVYLNGVPTAMTVNGNAVTFGTHADKLSNGFKIRTTSTTFNQNASTYNYSITTTGDPFKTARAQSN
jgi:hypothetical protein